MIGIVAGSRMRGADETASSSTALFRQYCFQCHGKGATMAGISLEQLTAKGSLGENSQQWEKVAAAQARSLPEGKR